VAGRRYGAGVAVVVCAVRCNRIRRVDHCESGAWPLHCTIPQNPALTIAVRIGARACVCVLLSGVLCTQSVARMTLAGVGAGKWLLFGGGTDGTTDQSAVDRFDSTTAPVWTRTSNSLSVARSALAAAACASSGGVRYGVFAGGSLSGVAQSAVDVFRDDTAALTAGPALSQARHSLSGMGSGDLLMFGGGHTGAAYSAVVDLWNCSTNSWTTAALSTARSLLAAAANGPVFAFGGGAVSTGYSAAVDLFDARTRAWSTATLSVARSLLAAAAAGPYIVFAGGEGTGGGGGYQSAIDMLNTQTMTVRMSLSHARAHSTQCSCACACASLPLRLSARPLTCMCVLCACICVRSAVLAVDHRRARHCAEGTRRRLCRRIARSLRCGRWAGQFRHPLSGHAERCRCAGMGLRHKRHCHPTDLSHCRLKRYACHCAAHCFQQINCWLLSCCTG
jgi:hypothetical protein